MTMNIYIYMQQYFDRDIMRKHVYSMCVYNCSKKMVMAWVFSGTGGQNGRICLWDLNRQKMGGLLMSLRVTLVNSSNSGEL